MDNLLSWETSIAEFSPYTELFVWLKLAKIEAPDPIDAEIQAIKQIQELRFVHREQGIEKSDRHYEYLKMAMLGNIEQGYVVLDRHYETMYLN
jgi:hypothetical protein